MIAHLFCDLLKIHIDTIQTCIERLSNKLAYHIRTALCITQYCERVDLVSEIINQSPYFQPCLVCRVDIIAVCQGGKIPACVLNREPCRGNGGKSGRSLDNGRYICVGRLTCHLVPCQVDLIVLMDAGVLRFIVLRLSHLCLSFSKCICLGITDVAVACPDLHPVSSLLDHYHVI